MIEIDWAEWGPPLTVVLAAGVAAVGVGFSLKKDEASAKDISARGHTEDLQGRHDEALEALAALEMQQDVMAPEDYQAERRALLEKGAKAMREMDEGSTAAPNKAQASNADVLTRGITELTGALKRGEIDEVTYAKAVAALSEQASAPQKAAPSAPSGSPVAAPASTPAVSPAWQGAAYAIVGALVLGGLLYAAQNQSIPRGDNTMTGGQSSTITVPAPGQPPAATGEPPWVATKRAEAQKRLDADPNDVAALNELTQLALGEPDKAWSYNEKARKADPEDINANMLNGVITAIMGMPDKAQEKFDTIVAKHPDHAPTWAWKGLTYAETSEWDKAAEALEKAKSLGLSDHTIDNTLALAKNGGVPPNAPPAPPPAAGGSAVIASGVVNIDPNRASFKAQTLFVNIKDPAQPGPPIAAKKLPPGPYPLAFSITEADKIGMGGPMGNRPIPANVQLSLRLDTDGNAFTKKPEDPQIVLEVPKGSKGLELTLK